MNFRLVSGPCGAPFFTIGGHYFDSWVWNGENFVCCGQLDSRLDFMTKSDEFLGCLGWLKQRFGVRGVVKITFSVEHWFSRFWALFYLFFWPENGTKVDMWFTLGVPGAPTGGIESRFRFCRFFLIQGTPRSWEDMVRWGKPNGLGGMVTTKHRLPRYQTTNILRYKDTKVKTYEVTKATILPVTTNASQPGGPHKGGRRI